ncbi:MAG: Fe-S cluster assembly protein NifU [Oceanospirillaceae bacterium]|jgi:NifU-like protein|uniref:Fe-S cluster assembly protein NifU n=1 Tax=Marinobacterium litorale TaxID=404770 RepID=UPI0003FCD183|nr:Fe-S cluster assembly protein NifU [Marinobacterium litorale]MBS99345.1 Fe-S cluster assembly protein NifU [Oceanospirillaceae bacterium]
MWDYSEKVKEHFYDPKNAGAVEGANGVGDVGSISCGDALRLTLKVDPETEVILDAGFQTFGCGSAIASSSALTEMIKGMTLDDALKISNQDIADYLDGLPPEKMHCSVMGREALQAAVANYRGEVWEDDHEEGALVCKCFAIDEVMIEDTIRANNLSTVEEVTNYTKAGGGCSSCHEGIENILTRVMAERGETFSAGGAVPAPAPAAAAAKPGKMTTLQRIRKIEQILESIRPALQADNGDVELVDVDGNTIYVNLTGACTGCQMAAMTMGGIQQRLIEDLGEFVKVVPAPKESLVSMGA